MTKNRSFILDTFSNPGDKRAFLNAACNQHCTRAVGVKKHCQAMDSKDLSDNQC